MSDIGYVRLNDRIVEANHEGDATNFFCDSHYNDLGNQLMADVMFEWLSENLDNRQE